jgi:GAF domain-containing protein
MTPPACDSLPGAAVILAGWNKGAERPEFINLRFTLEEYGVVQPAAYGEPIVLPDIQSLEPLPLSARARYSRLHTKSPIILPLIASGEWHGLLSLHFSIRRMLSLDDLRHLRGLVDPRAIAIRNERLLEAD